MSATEPRLDETLTTEVRQRVRAEDPVSIEARLVRHQLAMDVLRYPEVHELEHELALEQRESLLAAVVWPRAELLEWSVARARAKLEQRLAG